MPRKPDTFGSKPVDMGRLNDRLSVTAQVAVAQIIGKDIDDVGLFGRFLVFAARYDCCTQ